MKIGLVVPGFSADERDWCIPAHRNLARVLASQHEVHVFALRYPHKRDVYRVDGAVVHSYNGNGRHGLGSARMRAAVLNGIRREHLISNFDVLHSIYGGEPGFVTVISARLLQTPSLVSLVGGELAALKDISYGQRLRRRQWTLNRVAVWLADRVLCGSNQMKEAARALDPKQSGERIQLLPLGVDTTMFSPVSTIAKTSLERHLTQETRSTRQSSTTTDAGDWANEAGRSANSTDILNVGSLIPVKDQTTLLEAMAIFVRQHENARLCIIGSGPLEPHLRVTASNLGIAAQVGFAGAVPHEQLPEWYRRSNLYVQSSRHEGQGMAVLEAAASGVPIAGTNVGVLADLAAKGAAIVVRPGQADALAMAMGNAMSSASEISLRAVDLARSDYDIQAVCDNLVQVYLSLQAHRNGGHDPHRAIGLDNPLRIGR